jgi:RNA polymerase sigma factor (sigma-70 family)
MTLDELEQCMRTELPCLRKKLVKVYDDGFVFQRAMIALWKKVDQLSWTTLAEFHSLFESYFHMWKFDQLTKASKRHKVFKEVTWSEYAVTKEETFKKGLRTGTYELASDPWNTPQSQALEYIDLLDDTRSQEVFISYYIKGLTLTETAVLFNIKKSRVHQLLEEGIVIIRTKLHTLESIN